MNEVVGYVFTTTTALNGCKTEAADISNLLTVGLLLLLLIGI